MRIMLLLVGIVFATGCVVRTYEIEKPRKDLDIEGNRGYLVGEPSEEPPENRLGTTRTVSVLEIELGKRYSSQVAVDDEEAVGYDDYSDNEEDSYSYEGSSDYEESDELSYEDNYREYTVQKNDTLQKISRKFYGTTRKWQMLYEQNKDVLKSPDKIYPGMKIKIPVLD
jgi:LysM repeat protein